MKPRGADCLPSSSPFPASPGRPPSPTRNTGTRTTCDASASTSTCGSATSLRCGATPDFPGTEAERTRLGGSSADHPVPPRSRAWCCRDTSMSCPPATSRSGPTAIRSRPRVDERRDVWARCLRHEGGPDCQPGGGRSGLRSGAALPGGLALHSVVSEEDGGLGAFATLERGHRGAVASSPSQPTAPSSPRTGER